MTYRSSTVRTGSSTAAPAFAVPPGAESTDIAVVCMFAQDAGAITPATDFTQKFDSGMLNAYRKVVFWKRLTGADSGSYTFTMAGSNWVEGTCVLFSGRIESGDPFTAFSEDDISSATTLDAPAITAAEGDDLIGSGFSFNGGGAWTPPSGMTERQDRQVDAGITLATQDNVTAGSTGAKTFATTAAASGIKVFLGALAAEPVAPQEEGTKNQNAMQAMTGGRF